MKIQQRISHAHGALQFSSKICLMSESTFKKITAANRMSKVWQEARYPYNIKNRVSLQYRGFTTGAFDCNAGGITNTKDVSLFHLLPLNANLRGIKKCLKKDIFQLKKEGTVNGIIVAGRAYHDEKRSKPSQRLHKYLMNILKETGVRPAVSQFWGRKSFAKNGPTGLLYDRDNDTWGLLVQINDKARRTTTEILSRQGLEETFARVHIAPGDQLITPEDGVEYRQCLDSFMNEYETWKKQNPEALEKMGFPSKSYDFWTSTQPGG